MKHVLLALACPFFLGACAATDPQAAGHGASGERAEPVYTTGSNIPRRERGGPSAVRSVDPVELERLRSSTAGGIGGGPTN